VPAVAASPLRERRRLLLACGLAAALLAVHLVTWARVTPRDVADSDFSATWVASTLWRDGQGAQLYDQRLETARHTALFPPGSLAPGTVPDLPFITPPTTAVLAAPLAGLGLPTAYRIWSLLQLALVALAVGVAVRAAPWSPGTPRELRAAAFLGGTAGVGSLVLLLHGQWDGVSALSLALTYASWRRGHPGRAGALLMGGALLAKPHLAVGLAAWLLAQRHRRAVAGAVAGLVAVAAASLVLAGPAACEGWLGSLAGSATHSPLPSLLGFTGLFGSWIRVDAVAQALAAVASVAAVGACWLLGDRSRRRPGLLEPSLAGATALSLVAAPHLLMHDLALLAPALAWTVAWAAARGPRCLAGLAAGWVLLNLAAVLDLGNASSAPPGRLVPLALVAAGLLAARRCGVEVRPRRRGRSRPAGLPAAAG
jgi:Glycosyltransferase family 87